MAKAVTKVLTNTVASESRKGLGPLLRKDFQKYKYAYLMGVPMLVFYLVFCYWPMYGAIIAFKDYMPAQGFFGSPWVGFKHFQDFITGFYFWRLLYNTLTISLSLLAFGFPAPIILALLLNEVRNNAFKRTVQTISYLPHFISIVVICGLIADFTTSEGLINWVWKLLGGQPVNMLTKPGYFVPIYVISGIWQHVGWNSIIYLAALAGISPELYEAAVVDGANRWKQTLHITLPGIAPTIIILLILRVGEIMSVGFEKILLLYNPAIYEVADVISTYVYRKGLLEFNWSFSSAVGLFNSVINFILLVSVNRLSRKLSDTSLW